MIPFNRDKFNQEFLQSDGWKVSPVYISFSDRYMRGDAQDAYEGAKWAWDEAQRALCKAPDTRSEGDYKDFVKVAEFIEAVNSDAFKSCIKRLQMSYVTIEFLKDLGACTKLLQLVNLNILTQEQAYEELNHFRSKYWKMTARLSASQEEDCHDYLKVSSKDLKDGSICAGDAKTENLSVLLDGKPIKRIVIANVDRGFVVGFDSPPKHHHGELIYRMFVGKVEVKEEE